MSDLWYRALDAIGKVAFAPTSYRLDRVNEEERPHITEVIISACRDLVAFAAQRRYFPNIDPQHLEDWRNSIKAPILKVGGEEWRKDTFDLIDIAIDAIMKAAEAQHSRGAA